MIRLVHIPVAVVAFIIHIISTTEAIVTIVESIQWVRTKTAWYSKSWGSTISSIYFVAGFFHVQFLVHHAIPNLQHHPVKLFLSNAGGQGIHWLMIFGIAGPVPAGIYCCGRGEKQRLSWWRWQQVWLNGLCCVNGGWRPIVIMHHWCVCGTVIHLVLDSLKFL